MSDPKAMVYIHVGITRTGNTYLREMFYSRLSCKDVTFNPPSIMAILLKVIRKQEVTHDEILRIRELQAKETFYGKKKLIISREEISFYGFNPELKQGAQLIAKIFPAAQIIITLRYQTDWLVSLYRTAIDNGGCVNIKTFLNFQFGTFQNFPFGIVMSCNGPINIYNANWASFVQNFKDIYGENNVSVMFNEELKKDQLAFFRRLNQLLGSSIDSMDETTFVNRGPSALTCLFICYHGKILKFLRLKPRNMFDWYTRIAEARLLGLKEAMKTRNIYLMATLVLKKSYMYLKYAPIGSFLRLMDGFFYVDWDLLKANGLRKKLDEIYKKINCDLLLHIKREDVPEEYLNSK